MWHQAMRTGKPIQAWLAFCPLCLEKVFPNLVVLCRGLACENQEESCLCSSYCSECQVISSFRGSPTLRPCLAADGTDLSPENAPWHRTEPGDFSVPLMQIWREMYSLTIGLLFSHFLVDGFFLQGWGQHRQISLWPASSQKLTWRHTLTMGAQPKLRRVFN